MASGAPATCNQVDKSQSKGRGDADFLSFCHLLCQSPAGTITDSERETGDPGKSLCPVSHPLSHLAEGDQALAGRLVRNPRKVICSILVDPAGESLHTHTHTHSTSPCGIHHCHIQGFAMVVADSSGYCIQHQYHSTAVWNCLAMEEVVPLKGLPFSLFPSLSLSPSLFLSFPASPPLPLKGAGDTPQAVPSSPRQDQQ